jgi:hypothetical protein
VVGLALDGVAPSKSVTLTPSAGDLDDLVLAQLDGVAGELDEGGTSEATNISPSPTPTTSGELRRAATSGRDRGRRPPPA